MKILAAKLTPSQVVVLINKAVKTLEANGSQPTARQVQSWLKEQHGMHLPFDQVHGNMLMVRTSQGRQRFSGKSVGYS